MKYSEAKQYLKEGMTVRVITHNSYSGNYAGKKYKIDAVGSGNITNLAFNCIGGPLIYQDDEFEILTNPDGSKWIKPSELHEKGCDMDLDHEGRCAKDKPQFKVGDRVRVIEVTDCMSGFSVGNEAVIDNTSLGNSYRFQIRINKNNLIGYCDSKNLELVEECADFKEKPLPEKVEYSISIPVQGPSTTYIIKPGQIFRLNDFPTNYTVTSSLKSFNRKKTTMHSIFESVKAKLSPTDRTLVGAGYLNSDGTLTESYKENLKEMALQRLINAEDTAAFRKELAAEINANKKSC